MLYGLWAYFAWNATEFWCSQVGRIPWKVHEVRSGPFPFFKSSKGWDTIRILCGPSKKGPSLGRSVNTEIHNYHEDTSLLTLEGSYGAYSRKMPGCYSPQILWVPGHRNLFLTKWFLCPLMFSSVIKQHTIPLSYVMMSSNCELIIDSTESMTSHLTRTRSAFHVCMARQRAPLLIVKK